MDNRGFYDSMGNTFGHVSSVGSYHAYGIDVRVIGFWYDVRRRRFVVKVTFRVGGTMAVADIDLDSKFVVNLQNAGYILNKRYGQRNFNPKSLENSREIAVRLAILVTEYDGTFGVKIPQKLPPLRKLENQGLSAMVHIRSAASYVVLPNESMYPIIRKWGDYVEGQKNHSS